MLITDHKAPARLNSFVLENFQEHAWIRLSPRVIRHVMGPHAFFMMGASGCVIETGYPYLFFNFLLDHLKVFPSIVASTNTRLIGYDRDDPVVLYQI